MQYFSAEKNTFIAKFYGFHGIQVPMGNVIHMVVMANVVDSHLKIDEIYDLKVFLLLHLCLLMFLNYFFIIF